ncbi:MAG: sulfite exporter TauE/SafE family protein, partial [Armatimonadetes bacterium]|nr:sulfite exporter TauE/SafE family protein [Armatimonadota bacterium]
PIDLWLAVAYITLLSVVGLLMLREASRRLREPPKGGCVDTPLTRAVLRFPVGPFIRLPEPRDAFVSIWPLAAVWAVCGFFGGFLGMGGAFIALPALIYACGFPTRAAVGTNLGSALMVMAAAALGHWHQGHVRIGVAVEMGVGSSIGAYIGARIAENVRAARIRRWFGLVALATAAMLVLKLAGLLG